MLSLGSALMFTVLATVSASTPSNSYIKGDQVYVSYYDLSKIYGSLKFYVAASGSPAAGCATCPAGVNAEYVVPPEMVYQTWPQGGRYLQVNFPLSAVGGMTSFSYTAVSVLATEERFLGAGTVSTLLVKGGGRK